MVQLLATNNNNGTVTVSITGGTPLLTVDVYGAVFSSSFLGTWGLFGSVTLDGTGAGSGTWAAASGSYTFQALSGGVPYGTAARVGVYALAADALAAAFRAEIRTRIEGLGLFQDVQEQMYPDGSDLSCPGIILSPFGVAETDEGSLNSTDDTGFPTRVQIIDREDKYDHPMLSTYEFMRQEIAREFRSQQLNTRQESFICRVEFGNIIDVAERDPEYLVSELVIRAVGREPRHNQ